MLEFNKNPINEKSCNCLVVKRFLVTGSIFFFITISVGTGFAQQSFVYPKDGQSQEQQNKDNGECKSWASQQTGHDPANQTTKTEDIHKPQGDVVRGAGRGALAGVAIGAIADDAGKGAAIGATAGAFRGGFKRRDRVRGEQKAQENVSSQNQQNLESHTRAYSTCMQARGYSVN